MTHAIPGRGPVREALRAGRHLLEVVLDDRDVEELEAISAAAKGASVRVRRAPRAALDELSSGVLHQGAVAVAPTFPYIDLAAIGDTDLVVVLDGVTDPQNLGGIARSAEAAGAGALVLPRRRSATVGPAAEKAAAGAFGWLRVALVPNITRALADLAGRGFWTVGLTQEAGQPVWSSPLLDGKVALVAGSEGRGLSRLVAERVDGLVAIPQLGRLESLNVGAAVAIALFEVTRRRSMPG